MKIADAVARIEGMERRFDELTAALRSGNAAQATREDFVALSDYLAGAWFSDYALDQGGHLPPTLKRGVLAQDALYDLLCQADEQGIR